MINAPYIQNLKGEYLAYAVEDSDALAERAGASRGMTTYRATAAGAAPTVYFTKSKGPNTVWAISIRRKFRTRWRQEILDGHRFDVYLVWAELTVAAGNGKFAGWSLALTEEGGLDLTDNPRKAGKIRVEYKEDYVK
jgi:hypothetical protein